MHNIQINNKQNINKISYNNIIKIKKKKEIKKQYLIYI